MEVIHPEIIDFLDRPLETREPGLYQYYEDQVEHLEEIRKSHFGYKIQRKAANGRLGSFSSIISKFL